MFNGHGSRLILASWVLCSLTQAQTPQNPKLHPRLLDRFTETADLPQVKAWVLFSDKDLNDQTARRAAVRHLETQYNPRAIERRRNRRTAPGLFDDHDLPVPQHYLDAVAATGVQLRHVSKWVNGVSVLGTQEQLNDVARLAHVKMIQPVARGKKIKPVSVEPVQLQKRDAENEASIQTAIDYGLSLEQLTQINLVALHDIGFTGNGIIIGILDTGFQPTHVAFSNPFHPLSVVAEWDFINNDGNAGIELGDPTNQHAHGTYILGTLGAYKPGELVGAAYDASYILCKTEDTAGEYQGEEDNYVAALEFIEANGGDVATSSLSYIDWYTQADLDGVTAVTSIAVNIATANGIFCCTAAGNRGHDADPATARLGAPADALQVLTCGAVDSTGSIASFSSDGPSADGRVKPEVLARGVGTQTVSSQTDTTYAGVGGTSLSTPLIAGAVACLAQAHPNWTVNEMRDQLSTTASEFVATGTYDPQYVWGYGIIDAYAAAQQTDCNGNGMDDTIDIIQGTSADLNHNGVPDECDAPIPTVSQWGLAAMSLLLAVAGTIVLADTRRARPA